MPQSTTPVPPPPVRLRVFVEGHTDKDHVELALAQLQASGRFTDLVLDIDGKDRGSDPLLTMCQSLSQTRQWPPCVFLFDGDERKIVPQVSAGGDFKNWGNNVYSFVIPRPLHRSNDERWCIEHLYEDADLQATDSAGRRIYLATEFNPATGLHKTLPNVFHREKGSALVIDAVIHSTSSQYVSLSKHSFAELMRVRAATVAFGGFVPLFEGLLAIRAAATRAPV